MQAYAAQQVLSNPEAFARSFGQLGSAVSQITTPLHRLGGPEEGRECQLGQYPATAMVMPRLITMHIPIPRGPTLMLRNNSNNP